MTPNWINPETLEPELPVTPIISEDDSYDLDGNDTQYQQAWRRFCELRTSDRHMLSFHYLPSLDGDDKPPTGEQLEKKVLAALKQYHRESGQYIPMVGVCAPNRSGWQHVHILIQWHLYPLKSVSMLKRIGREHWLKVSWSNHRESAKNKTDLRKYVAFHLRLHGSRFLTGVGARQNFEKYAR